MTSENSTEQTWKALINGDVSWEKDRKRFGIFPSKHRCKNCNAPFDGIGAWIARLAGRGRYRRNPRFCDF